MQNIVKKAAVMIAVSGAAAAFGAPAFAPPTTIATAQRPAGVALADLNGDGARDLAVVVDAQDRVLVHLNDGSGGFGAPTAVFLPAGSGPDALLASDVDGDTDMDLVVVLKNNAQVVVLANTGGAFSARPAVATGAEPVSLQAGDIDGDGDADFVTANREGNSLTVLRNDAGTLVGSTVSAGEEPRDAAIGDLNGDGLGDLVCSNHRDRDISVMINTGAGFAARVNYPVNQTTRPAGVAISDLNGDGRADVATAISDDVAPNAAAVFFNSGGGVLAFAANYATGGLNPGMILAADFDGDGDADLVAANEDGGSVGVLDNNGAGEFAAPLVLTAGAHPGSMAVGDVSGDGLPELAVTNRDSNTTMVFGNEVTPPCRADFNGNGQVDFFDYLDFADAFSAEAPGADFDGNGQIDFFDYLEFVAAYSAGC